MRKILTLLLTLFLIISCQKENDSFLLKAKNSVLDSIETILGEISTKDINCLKSIDSAQEKIEKDSLTYYVIPVGSYYRYLDELKKLLKPHGIDCEVLSTSCIVHDKERRYCYEEYMNQTVKNKFKKGFLDSLEVKADRIYINKNIDKVFSVLDTYDKTIFYPKAKSVETQDDDVIEDFFANFKYPEGFIFKHDYYIGRSNVEFNLFKDGTIRNLTIETKFENSNNNKYIPYLENRIKQFILETKWVARKQRGITVNGGLGLWFLYEKDTAKSGLAQ